MKKTLAAVAVLGAFAASASADVTVYGKFDMGLGYIHSENIDKVEMKSGGSGASRFGLKGTEKIGDMTVGFVYEAGLNADTGKMNNTDSRLFSRVSMLQVKGSLGEIGVGYYGGVDSGTGAYDFVGGLSAMGTGWYSDMGGQQLVMKTKDTRLENAFSYKTPTFGGVTVVAQVATGTEAGAKDTYKFDTTTGTGKLVPAGDRAGAEYTHDVDMYYGLGVSYKAGALNAALAVSRTEVAGGVEDLNVTAGANYAFDFGTLYVAANYYDNGAKVDEAQYGVVVGGKTKVAGGTLMVNAGYGETEGAVNDTVNMFVGAGYQYDLSKQTALYAGAGYHLKDTKVDTTTTIKAIAGIVHNF